MSERVNPPMHYVRRGSGKPLLLVHGLGGSHHSWDTIVDALAMQRDLVIVDLPGFSITPPLPGEVSIATLSDAMTTFLAENDLTGIDAVGSSMGARLVLELARRGVVGIAPYAAPRFKDVRMPHNRPESVILLDHSVLG